MSTKRLSVFIIVLLLLLAAILALAWMLRAPGTKPAPPQIPASFVTVRGGKFMLDGQPYAFAGANFWQGMNLGMQGGTGNRAQLAAELDRMRALGITNLRVLAASEGPDSEPYRMAPALMTAPGEYNADVLDGLDYFVAEAGKRNLRVVMVLGNYWHWSGGMAQYVAWSEGGPIPYPGDWSRFMEYSARFYSCRECQTWYRAHIAMLIGHVNPYTGRAYRDEPAVFAWELANEPRRYPPGWIDGAADYIRSLDPNHLITTGSEGTPPGERQDFRDTHAGANIDYATVHIWPQNWGWYDPQNPASYDPAETRAREYFQQHADIAAALGKPLVLEEFGLARDTGPGLDLADPLAGTGRRDAFYAAMFAEVEASLASGGPVAGDNFWAWAGAARPGDPWVGDPPHETPGWYSVYDADASTLAVIAAHAKRVAAWIGAVAGSSGGSGMLLPRNEPYERTGPLRHLIYIPSGYSPDTPWPLVVGLHGAGGMGSHCIHYWRTAADAGRFILLCPDLEEDHGGWDHDVRKADVMAAVDNARREINLLPKALVVGFSRGAYLTQYIAYAFPQELAGAVTMAAVQYDPPPAGAEPVPFLVIIGDNDHWGGVEQVEAFTGQLRAAGFPAEKRILPDVGHMVTPAMSDLMLEFFRKIFAA